MHNGPTASPAPPAGKSVRLSRPDLRRERRARGWTQLDTALRVQAIAAGLPPGNPLAEAGERFNLFTVSRAERELPVALTTAQLLALAYEQEDPAVFYAAASAAA